MIMKIVGPNLGLTWGDDGTSAWGDPDGPDFQKLDTVVNAGVISTVDEPPGSLNDGDRYLVSASPSGAFSGHADAIALWFRGSWWFYAPQNGWTLRSEADGRLDYDGSSWVAGGGGGGGGGGIPDAPANNIQYARINALWEPVRVPGEVILFTATLDCAQIDYAELINSQAPGTVVLGPGGFYFYEGVLPSGSLGAATLVSKNDALTNVDVGGSLSAACQRVKSCTYAGAVQPDKNEFDVSWSYTTSKAIQETRIEFVEIGREFDVSAPGHVTQALPDPDDSFLTGTLTMNVYGVVGGDKGLLAPPMDGIPYIQRNQVWVEGSGKIVFGGNIPDGNTAHARGDWVVANDGSVWQANANGWAMSDLRLQRVLDTYVGINSTNAFKPAINTRTALDVTNGAPPITLPLNPQDRDQLVITDYTGQFATHPVTVNPSTAVGRGANINGSTNPYVMNIAGACYRFVYSDAVGSWVVER
jgi:hypothetical protein